MSKYKIGDKVYLEGEISDYDENDNTYHVDYSDYWERSQTSRWIKEEVLHTTDGDYNKGLNDAWELAKKIVGSPSNGGYTANELVEIFGIVNKPVLDAYTPQEALAKVRGYNERNEIKVGDVVKLKGCYIEGIVTRITETNICYLSKDGSCGNSSCNNGDFINRYFEKTGKHFDSIDEFMRSAD